MANLSTQITMTLYHIDSQNIDAQVLLKDNTIWATQRTIAELFGVNVSAISKHLKNIFDDGELDEKVVISKMETTTPHGAIIGKTQNKLTNFYNLDAIISVGYRVNSKKATHFRKMSEQSIKFTHPLAPSAREGEQKSNPRAKEGKIWNVMNPKSPLSLEVESKSPLPCDGETKISPLPCGGDLGVGNRNQKTNTRKTNESH